ncbi:intracellular short-chain-length polyhydroxyalkanoate depolymerase [Clostridium amazonitimonense]|uniref:intracellular short-chain-length polyhydroxyalkanoate depolymerase n=1 Tax=Clostridium amazonitimonense TaxID=1499689 RepID=UPI0005093C53|nr:alpha/beta hydrolase [Clostridium amazonitimonense]
MDQSITLKSIKLPNEETMSYREAGKGNKIMILVHGNMTSSKHMEILMKEFLDQYKIYAVDLRGFGKSTYNKRIDSLKDFSDDIKLFVDAMGLKDFVMMGWSTGGGVAMQFIADYPGYVSNLILLESVGIKGYPMFRKDENGQPILTELISSKEDIEKDPIQVAPVLQAYATKNKEYMRTLWNMAIYTKNKPEDNLYEEYLEDMMTQRNLVDVDYALVNFNMSNEHNGVVKGNGLVDKIDIPTLVFQGDRDYVVPREMGEEIVRGIGKNAKLVILEDSGHSPLIDCMDRLVKEIKQFLR